MKESERQHVEHQLSETSAVKRYDLLDWDTQNKLREGFQERVAEDPSDVGEIVFAIMENESLHEWKQKLNARWSSYLEKNIDRFAEKVRDGYMASI